MNCVCVASKYAYIIEQSVLHLAHKHVPHSTRSANHFPLAVINKPQARYACCRRHKAEGTCKQRQTTNNNSISVRIQIQILTLTLTQTHTHSGMNNTSFLASTCRYEIIDRRQAARLEGACVCVCEYFSMCVCVCVLYNNRGK